MKVKEVIQNKAKLVSKVQKRGKYLLNWVSYQCIFCNNSLYFYLSETELVPDSILSLRGAKIQKNIQKNQHDLLYQLEMYIDSEVTYLQYNDEITLNRWQAELIQSVRELKNMDALMLEGGGSDSPR